jgi:hypothetical protein
MVAVWTQVRREFRLGWAMQSWRRGVGWLAVWRDCAMQVVGLEVSLLGQAAATEVLAAKPRPAAARVLAPALGR